MYKLGVKIELDPNNVTTKQTFRQMRRAHKSQGGFMLCRPSGVIGSDPSLRTARSSEAEGVPCLQ